MAMTCKTFTCLAIYTRYTALYTACPVYTTIRSVGLVVFSVIFSGSLFMCLFWWSFFAVFLGIYLLTTNLSILDHLPTR